MFVIIDNFFSEPELERQKALQAQFTTLGHDGYSFPGMAIVEDAESLRKIEEALECAPPREATVTYRQYLAGQEQSTFIHNDSNIATISAIAFLTKDEDAKGSGLAFWKHKSTGWDGHPSVEQLGTHEDSPALWNSIVTDGLDESKWEMTHLVPMKFNRCVAFLSHRYHSRYPKEPLSASADKARLIKVFFYKL